MHGKPYPDPQPLPAQNITQAEMLCGCLLHTNPVKIAVNLLQWYLQELVWP